MEGYIGEVRMFGGNFAPRGWAFCDGQLLAISTNDALFSILGTMYGGDGRTTFALPDMRGRSCYQQGQGPGLPNYFMAQRSGHETTTLTTLNLPQHTHVANAKIDSTTVTYHSLNEEASSNSPVGNFPAFADSIPQYRSTNDGSAMHPPIVQTNNTLSTGLTGSSQYFDNHSPYTVVNFVICMYGIYPSRN